MTKKFLITGSIFGLIGIVLGAFGAHGLKPLLNTEQLASFETGVRYQFYHALFFLFVATLAKNIPQKQSKIIYHLTTWGVCMFSGSIYLLTLKNITNIDWLKFAGPITPIGGTLLIISWGILLFSTIKHVSSNDQ